MKAPRPDLAAKKGRRRLRFNLRKAMFVLPNLFTVSSIFCGFYAITLCLDNPEPIQLYRAAVAIFFGMFFDGFDGRVARLTKTQSEFGVQLDSLADLVSFGCAPAILLYRWSLQELGSLGLFVSFLFLACGALRLARFNVLAAHESGPSKHFVGLPIPLAAGTVVALVMASFPFERDEGRGILVSLNVGASSVLSFHLVPGTVLVVTVALALLMVSNIRYRTFKSAGFNRKSITLALVMFLTFGLLSAGMKPAIALAVFSLGYIVTGLLEEVIFFRSRREERREARRLREEKSALLVADAQGPSGVAAPLPVVAPPLAPEPEPQKSPSSPT